jgi:hypothetical protein
MSTRQSLILGCSMVLCSLILALGFGTPTLARQDKGPGAAAVMGRYRMTSGTRACYLYDTTTGQTWEMDGVGPPMNWRLLVNPLGGR